MRQFTIFDEEDLAKLVNDKLVVVYHNGVKQIYCSEKAYKEIYEGNSIEVPFSNSYRESWSGLQTPD